MAEKPSKLMPALYGGIIMGLISGIPFLNLVNCLCCAGIMFGGFMAVFFFKKDLGPDMPPLTNNDALALGALAGLFGALFANILAAIFLFTIGNVGAEVIYKIVLDVYDSLGVLDQMPPEAIEEMERSIMDSGLSPVNVIVSFIVNPLFGLVGGLIGYAVFKPKPAAPTQPPATV